MLTMEHTPAVSAIHPAKALLCVGRILYCAPMRVVSALSHGANALTRISYLYVPWLSWKWGGRWELNQSQSRHLIMGAHTLAITFS